MKCDAPLKLPLGPPVVVNLRSSALWVSFTVSLMSVHADSRVARAQTKTTAQSTSRPPRSAQTQKLKVTRSARKSHRRGRSAESTLHRAALRLKRLTPQLRTRFQVLSQLGSYEQLNFALDANEAIFPEHLTTHRASPRPIRSVPSLRVKSSMRKLRTTLSQIETLIRQIHTNVTLYYQAPRSLSAETSSATLRLRQEVWSLLHHTRGFFQRSDERFCLRAVWRNLIANAYAKLDEPVKSSLHRRHARACTPFFPTTREVDRDE